MIDESNTGHEASITVEAHAVVHRLHVHAKTEDAGEAKLAVAMAALDHVDVMKVCERERGRVW